VISTKNPSVGLQGFQRRSRLLGRERIAVTGAQKEACMKREQVRRKALAAGVVAVGLVGVLSADRVGIPYVALSRVVAAAAAEFSPFTSAPSRTDVPADGRCVKGRFECRWGGSCEQRGKTCLSCLDKYTWHDQMGTCYSCGEGQQLRLKNGQWLCVS
jgi:hypothetical protein